MTSWTVEMDAILVRGCSDGLSTGMICGKIADALYVRVTNSAVWHRMKTLGVRSTFRRVKWHEDDIERIRKLVGEGLSQSEIAAIFSAEGKHATRDAIGCIAARHGIRSKADQETKNKYKLVKHESATDWPVSTIGDLPADKTATGCRYVIGDIFRFGEGPWRYCNHEISKGMYCAEHAAICLIDPPAHVNRS